MSRVGDWLKKLKGIVGMGVLWSGASVLFGWVATVLVSVASGAGLPSLFELFVATWQWAMIGMGAGTLFGSSIALLYARRDLRRIRPVGFGFVGSIVGAVSVLLLMLAVGYVGRPGFAPLVALNVSLGGLLGWSTSRFAIGAAQRGPAELERGAPGDHLLTDLNESASRGS